ncbi:MAG: hypothetical protein Kow0037_07460 [Calditrichia bacterium]
MSRIFQNILILLFAGGLVCLPGRSYSQIFNVSAPGKEPALPVLMDSVANGFNLYDFSANSAALPEDEREFSLDLKSFVFYENGDYRRVLQPSQINHQYFISEMVKPLSERNIFKGNFGYTRQLDFDQAWLHQNRLREENPFILGDNSSGLFKSNGLFWMAEWARKFNPQFSGGLRLDYLVDQRLRQTFPKPENRHRDMQVKVSGIYRLSRWKLGGWLKYLDNQEKVIITKYNLDQNLTPVLYKFLFAGLPQILEGKTSEERLIEYSGPQASAQLQSAFSENWQYMLEFNIMKTSGKVEDGGSQPVSQGKFDHEGYRLKFNNRLRPAPFWSMDVGFSFTNQVIEYYHPDYDITLGCRQFTTREIVVANGIRIRPGIHLYIDGTLSWQEAEFSERALPLYFDQKWLMPQIRTGLSFPVAGRLRAQTWWSGFLLSGYKETIRGNADDAFTTPVLLDRADYFKIFNKSWNSGAELIYRYGPMWDLRFRLQAGQFLAKNTTHLISGKKRTHIFLQVSIKFYII